MSGKAQWCGQGHNIPEGLRESHSGGRWAGRKAMKTCHLMKSTGEIDCQWQEPETQKGKDTVVGDQPWIASVLMCSQVQEHCNQTVIGFQYGKWGESPWCDLVKWQTVSKGNLKKFLFISSYVLIDYLNLFLLFIYVCVWIRTHVYGCSQKLSQDVRSPATGVYRYLITTQCGYQELIPSSLEDQPAL